MLTSQADGKFAGTTYVQLILWKKSEKFVLTAQNCPVCISQRDDISLGTPGRAHLIEEEGWLWRLKFSLASLLPMSSPNTAASH